MRRKATALAAALFLTVAGVAQAGTITKVGAVNAMTNVSQFVGVVSSGNFDEGPTSGAVPVGVYSAAGLTWRTGTLSSILPGVTNTGSAFQPQYTTGAYFPLPIAGGGTQTGNFNMFAGVATFSATITQVGLTASKNGVQYLTAYNGAGGMIGQVTWTPANDSAFVGIDTLGVPIAMIAYGNDDLWSGATYDISGSTIFSDSWRWAGKCTASSQCDDSNVCTNDICDVNGICQHVNNAVTCNDNNACTTVDVCSNGACVGGSAVTCMPLDQCHSAGTCNTTTGVCSNPPKADGTTCADGNGCTQTDTCQAGTCVGANPVVCPSPDACHSAGTCNPGTGICTNPTKPDGTTCSDSNSCTQTDTCVAGTCTGMNPVVCAPIDGCHDPGTCNTSTGTCSTPPKADGSMCTDNNACTQMDTCVAGVCTGANPVTCAAMDTCHDVGMCDMVTGMCTNPAKANGVMCSDNNSCTQADSCQNGVCTGANPVACTAMDSCHDVGTCAMGTGQCSNPAKADGTACPGGGTCHSGACVVPDGGAGDAGQDASTNDASTSHDASASNDASSGSDANDGVDSGDTGTSNSGGCGCTVRPSSHGGFAALGFGLIAILFRRRSRSRR